MSEENTNNVLPAMLSEGEAVIPAHKVEEFKAAVEEILQTSQKNDEEPVVEETVLEDIAEPVVDVAEEVVVDDISEPTVSVAEEAVENNVVSSASNKTNTPSDFAAGLTAIKGGAIGTGAVKRKPSAKKPEPKAESKTSAVHSSKNVSWSGVGKVYRGYNIVTPSQAEKWLTKSYIRIATPEEIAQEFGR